MQSTLHIGRARSEIAVHGLCPASARGFFIPDSVAKEQQGLTLRGNPHLIGTTRFSASTFSTACGAAGDKDSGRIHEQIVKTKGRVGAPILEILMGRTFTIDQTSLPDLPQLMLATTQALKELGGSAAIEELNQTVTEREGVSEIEQSYLMPNGRDQRLAYYLAWARTFLKRGDALSNSARGVWNLTDVGDKIATRTDTLAIYNKVNE